MKKRTILIILFVLGASFLFSVRVKKIEIKDYKDFEKGIFKGTGLTNNGELFLGPKTNVLKGPEKEFYLSVETGKNGDIFIGTGHNGSVFRMGKDGKQEEIFKSNELDVYALMYNSNGNLYAGTSPRGKVYRISKDKKVKEFFNPDEKYIWDIKEDKEGNIICAVGGSGGIYKIDKAGRSAKIFTSNDTHIISLHITKDNSIIAGSGENGILYRINNKKGSVLYDTPYEEVRGICEDNEGNIYFSASKDIKSKSGLKPVMGNPIFSFGKKIRVSPVEKSALYCKYPNGEVEKIWSSRTEHIYSIGYDKKNNGVIVATGNKGRLYRVKKDHSFSIIYEGDSAQAYKISSYNGDVNVIFNNTSSIVKIEGVKNTKGVYFSEVKNLAIQSRLGKLYWDSNVNGKPDISFFIRTGNTSHPDSTWTDWSAPFTDNNNSNTNISGSRYFQIKTILNSTDLSKKPVLWGYKLYYKQQNLKPEISSIKIESPKSAIKTPEIKKQPPKNFKHLIVKWHATDPNKDKLRYSLSMKKLRGKVWININSDLNKTTSVLNTELYEDGKYIIKVKAEDSWSNDPDNFKQSEKISKSFTIDSTAPILSKFQKTNNTVTFNVDDSTSAILEVLYSFDGKRWFPLSSLDKINDSKAEAFKFTSKKIKNNKILFLKVSDEFNNYKVFQKEL
ncbi:MAG: fibronectin type III domain-containing protein [Acidobacteriota bacterium]